MRKKKAFEREAEDEKHVGGMKLETENESKEKKRVGVRNRK